MDAVSEINKTFFVIGYFVERQQMPTVSAFLQHIKKVGDFTLAVVTTFNARVGGREGGKEGGFQLNKFDRRKYFLGPPYKIISVRLSKILNLHKRPQRVKILQNTI